MIDTIYRIDHELGLQLSEGGTNTEEEVVNEKIAQGKIIIGQISQLKYEMAHDRPLRCAILYSASNRSDRAICRPVSDDGEPYVDEYNVELAELAKDGRNTWFTAPWLFAECASSPQQRDFT